MKKQPGFSLIEALVTVVIIAILAAIAVPIYTRHVARSRSADAASALSLVKAKQEFYRSTHFTYTGNLADLPGFDNNIENWGEFYQITILAADANTFTAEAADRQRAIGRMAAGTDRWIITESLEQPQHDTYGY